MKNISMYTVQVRGTIKIQRYSSCFGNKYIFTQGCISGNKNKGKGNGAGLVWESQSHCFADEFVTSYYTHTLLVQTHNMTTVKEIAEQCRQL